MTANTKYIQSYPKTEQRYYGLFSILFHYPNLLKFVEEHGHADVPKRFKNCKKLGAWVAYLRVARETYLGAKEGTVHWEIKKALEKVNFKWTGPYLPLKSK
jgi:hypothetical protein